MQLTEEQIHALVESAQKKVHDKNKEEVNKKAETLLTELKNLSPEAKKYFNLSDSNLTTENIANAFLLHYTTPYKVNGDSFRNKLLIASIDATDLESLARLSGVAF